MAVFVGLLRGINVGGSGKLAMSDLRKLCEDQGLEHVTTYIQSGNVVFSTDLNKTAAQRELEAALFKKMGRRVGVQLRTPSALEAIIEGNPFPQAPPHQVLVWFLDRAWPPRALAEVRTPGHEEIGRVGREVVVYYPDGMGRSKLRLPFAQQATSRNLNTVKRLHDLSRDLVSRMGG